MTNHTEGIIDISNGNAGPSAENAEIKDMIQEKLNGDDTTYSQQPMTNMNAYPSEAARVLAMEARAKKISHESWVRRKDHET